MKFTERAIKELTPIGKPFDVADETLRGLLVRVQPSGVMTYWYAYRTHQGKKNRISLGRCDSVSLVKAKELAKRYAGQVAAGIDPQAQRQDQKANAKQEKVKTLGTFIKEVYEPWATINRKSYKKTLRILDVYFSVWSLVPMNKLTHAMVMTWQEKELNRKISPATVKRNLNALRGVLTLAVDKGVLAEHPLNRLKNVQQYDEERIRYLSVDENVRLMQALEARNQELIDTRRSGNSWRESRRYPLLLDIPDSAYADHLYPMVMLALNTGMRKGEILALAWDCVDFETGLITVRASIAKNGRVRRIPMNAVSVTCLRRWQESPIGTKSGLVFPGKEGKPLTDIKKSWGSLLDAADIKDFRFHDMRHHFASKLVMSGVSLIAVQKLLGHASIETTMRYAHLGPNQLVDAVNRLTS